MDQSFFLDDFITDTNVMKQGVEAYVVKGFHSSHGEVAIKKWSNKSDREVNLLMQNFSHRNIIQLIGILIDNESKCIGYIMPYMSMGSLEDVIHNRSRNYDNIYTDEQITRWIIQICYGISHLHFNRIVHRDIKPSNILLGKSYDDVKLSDIGIARSLDKITNDLMTGFDQIIKCPLFKRYRRGAGLYISPEIINGQTYNSSADIYSLSITIWEILHRRAPYDHVVDKFDLLTKISNGERPALKYDLSKEIPDFLTRCWHTDASRRPIINYVLEFSWNTGFTLMSSKIDLRKGNAFFGNVKTLPAVDNYIITFLASTNGENLSEICLGKQNDVTKLLKIEAKPEKETVLLLGGGDGLDSEFLVFLPNNEQNTENWKELTIKLPCTIRLHGAQFLNNCLYIFGGTNAKKETLSCSYQLFKNLKWEKTAEMNEKRTCIVNSSVILNSFIWVLGGWNEKETLKTVEAYDLLTNSWKYMREMNECRAGAAAAVVNGKIYCCGGWNGKCLKSTECYDPSSDIWTRICDMPISGEGLGAAAMDGSLIVMGGRTGEGDYLSSVWVLDTAHENAQWIAKPGMPSSRTYFSITNVNGKIFVCGGNSYVGTTDDVNIFDGEVWRNGPKLKTPRKNAVAIVIPMDFAKDLQNNNTEFETTKDECSSENSYGIIQVPETIEIGLEKERILMLGGWDGKYLNSLVILQDNGKNWKDVAIKLPYAVRYHGAQFINNHLYIFGGENNQKNTLNSTYMLSDSLKWEEMKKMKEKRYSISNSSVILNDRIWVLGGYNGSTRLKSVETYDPVTNKWKFMRSIKKCRSRASAAVVNGRIFCCGGWNDNSYLKSAECYDPFSDVWTLIAEMPRLNAGLAAVGTGDDLIVIGGSSGTKALKSVWALDTTDENAKWLKKSHMLLPRCNFSIAKINGDIFVCGGNSNGLPVGNVEIFDGKAWRKGTNMKAPRFAAATVVIPIDFANKLK